MIRAHRLLLPAGNEARVGSSETRPAQQAGLLLALQACNQCLWPSCPCRSAEGPAARALAAAHETREQQQQQRRPLESAGPSQPVPSSAPPSWRGRPLMLELPGEAAAAIAAQLEQAADRARFACACKATAQAARDNAAAWWGSTIQLFLPGESPQDWPQGWPGAARLRSLETWLAARRPAIHTLNVALQFSEDYDMCARQGWWDEAMPPGQTLVLPAPPRECAGIQLLLEAGCGCAGVAAGQFVCT